jgi:hypothetical protein
VSSFIAPDWVLVTGQGPTPSPSSPSDVIGRYAFAVYDEGGVLKAQLANREIEVVGTVALGASFGADGNVVMSTINFRRLVPSKQASDSDLVRYCAKVLRLSPKICWISSPCR